MSWTEITALCLELRKSILKTRYHGKDDEELAKMMFAEAVNKKEEKWKSIIQTRIHEIDRD